MDSGDERESPRRATRKRATRAGNASGRRQRASRSSEEKVEPVKRKVEAPDVKPVSSSSRKAPTEFASKKLSKKAQQKRKLTILAVVVIGVGISAGIGFTDKGQIDVEETIEARNERIRNNQASETDLLGSTEEVLPVQNTTNSRKADGGLKGLGQPAPPPKPPAETSSSTATSSDATATSTEAIASSTEATVEDEGEVDTEETVE